MTINQENKTKSTAEMILLWAKENNLFRRDSTEQAVDFEEEEGTQVSNRAFNAAETIAIFRKRSVNYVVYDELNSIVTVFTSGRLTKGEIKSIPFKTENDVTINYAHGGAPLVRPATGSSHTKPVWHKDGVVACGSSIHPIIECGAGTFGALVKDQNGTIFGLTNNHVSGGCNYSTPDVPIVCPGPLDACETKIDPFTIGRHTKLLTITDGLPENVDISNNYDAALFKITETNRVSSSQAFKFDTPSKVESPHGLMKVEKYGRTTGHTIGKVIGQYATPIDVHYSYGNFRKAVYFSDAWVINGENNEPFSEPGDSGSLVVGTNSGGERVAVGLVFAGNPQTGQTFVLPLKPMLDRLGVELLSGHNAEI